MDLIVVYVNKAIPSYCTEINECFVIYFDTLQYFTHSFYDSLVSSALIENYRKVDFCMLFCCWEKPGLATLVYMDHSFGKCM